ncbi:hypothetical protein EfmAA242_35380 (plasmid) [Enterococcus faecium]|nr:hypothetical protein EfmAA242_35380 [Enterococcus faecium]
MNIIQQYELKYITFDQLSEEIWGYGQRLINEVGVERFSFYVEAAAGYHNFRFYIFPLYCELYAYPQGTVASWIFFVFTNRSRY